MHYIVRKRPLYKAVTSCFETAFEEERNLPEEIREKWPGLTSLVAVERHKKSKSITKIDTHFYVTSVEPDAQMLQKAIRHHWHIKNQQHWVLDVVFKEDACQISEPISAENMALFRRVVCNLVKQHTGRKDSICGKCVRASFDDEFRAELIVLSDVGYIIFSFNFLNYRHSLLSSLCKIGGRF